MANYKDAVSELLKGIQYMVDKVANKSTKIYNGLVKSSADNGKWNIQFNGETHAIKPYGSISPKFGMVVKVFVPDNNITHAFFM